MSPIQPEPSSSLIRTLPVFRSGSTGQSGSRNALPSLQRAGVQPQEVDYINAHGTGAAKNDSVEAGIIKRAFGEDARRIPVSSSKSMLGHMIGASAAIELIIAVLAIHNGVVPPTINLSEPDPECDLDYVVDGARRMPLQTVLSTSFGFGSRNAALVVRRIKG